MPDSFTANTNDVVYAMLVQADGKILVGGAFTNIGGQARNYIARLDPTTGAVDSFNPNAVIQVPSDMHRVPSQSSGMAKYWLAVLFTASVAQITTISRGSIP